MMFPLVGYIGPGAGFAAMGYFLALALALCGALVLVLLIPLRVLWRKIRGWKSNISARKRMVILGLDGLDPGLARELMGRGELPWMKKLADEGFFGELRTTMTAISPAAWSSFMTGVNPGKHNIFDFIMPDRRTYKPLPANVRVHAGKVGRRMAGMYSLRKSRPFWEILGEAGIFCTILRVPMNFPPDSFNGLCLAGMGTPDLRGAQSSFTYYAENHKRRTEPAGGEDRDEGVPAPRNGTSASAPAGGITIGVAIIDNRIKTYLPGPMASGGGEALKIPIEIRLAGEVGAVPGSRFTVGVPDVDAADGRGFPESRSSPAACMKVGGQKINLRVGEFTPWVKLTFRQGLKRVHGICQFLLISGPPEFRLYATPVQIDPERPDMPVSSPGCYSIYLAKRHGEFATLGLAEDTGALNAGVLDDQSFLTQAYAIQEERERIYFDALRKTRAGLCAAVFDFPDRVQHMFYTAADDLDREDKSGEVIKYAYRRMDDLIGRTLLAIDGNTILLVLSDHGFAEFRRGININAWLREQGLLVMKDAGTEDAGDGFDRVDWSKTSAYAMGLGGIYLNLRGREARGMVRPGEDAEQVKARIIRGLSGMKDPATGQPAILNVHDSRKIYKGAYVENAPDLLIGCARGYRIAWESVLGYKDTEVFVDNGKKWRGDHAMDAGVVPGVLMANRAIETAGRDVSIVDIALTVLGYFGLEPPEYMDGKELKIYSPRKIARNT